MWDQVGLRLGLMAPPKLVNFLMHRFKLFAPQQRKANEPSIIDRVTAYYSDSSCMSSSSEALQGRLERMLGELSSSSESTADFRQAQGV